MLSLHRHLGGGDSVVTEKTFHQIQNYSGNVSVKSKLCHTADLRRLNKAVVVIQVCISSLHLL